MERDQVRAAEVVLPCADLDETLRFFTDELGFLLEAIFPADDPAVAVIAGYGVRLRLQRGDGGAPGVLRLSCIDVPHGLRELTAPNGTRIELVEVDLPVKLPPLRASFVLSRMANARWVTGRAGMRYRNLIPDHQGGRFGASHIQIAGGGPVGDYVHFHRVHFQMIYCAAGWVKVVYEDQGPPFVLQAGDCVLQPPEIRHRVLESSAGLEVVEVSCPAHHETHADHELELPSPPKSPQRVFGGQHFARAEAHGARWSPWRLDGFDARDLGLFEATNHFADARVVRLAGAASPQRGHHEAQLLFIYLLQGGLTVRCGEIEPERLGPGDSVVLPPRTSHVLEGCADDTEFLEVTVHRAQSPES